MFQRRREGRVSRELKMKKEVPAAREIKREHGLGRRVRGRW
jgi:hypothetical protein